MLTALERHLDRRSPTEAVLIGLVLMALVGALDHLTGYQLSFSIFYLVPIALVSWRAPRQMSFLLSALSAAVWLAADLSSGHSYSHGLIPVWNAAVRLGFFMATAYLLVELKKRLKQEQVRARTDGLTGVLNARAFKDVSSGLLLLAARKRLPVALGYLDLDNFKALNDGSGHSEGDRVLQEVAGVLSRCLRASDVAGRLGGDEFAVLLPDSDLAGARRVFDRIRQELVTQAAGHGWPIGFSIGVAVLPQVFADDVEEAVRMADRIMYRVKKAGKNHVIYEERSAVGRDVPSTVPGEAPIAPKDPAGSPN